MPGILNRVDYDEHGLAVRREYANGAVSTAHYDAMDRVDALGTVTHGQTVQSLAVGYDRVGNVASIADAAHAGGPLAATRTFGYDDLYRLRTAEASRAAGPTTSTRRQLGARSRTSARIRTRASRISPRRRAPAGPGTCSTRRAS